MADLPRQLTDDLRALRLVKGCGVHDGFEGWPAIEYCDCCDACLSLLVEAANRQRTRIERVNVHEGAIDELVAHGPVHLEQMNDGVAWASIAGHVVWFRAIDHTLRIEAESPGDLLTSAARSASVHDGGTK